MNQVVIIAVSIFIAVIGAGLLSYKTSAKYTIVCIEGHEYYKTNSNAISIKLDDVGKPVLCNLGGY